MKKRVLILLILAVAILVPNYKVNAEVMAQFLRCPSEVTKGQVFSCDVYVTASNDDAVIKISGALNQNATTPLDHYEKGNYITSGSENKVNFNYESTMGVPIGETVLKVYAKVDSKTEFKEGTLKLILNEVTLKNGGKATNITIESNKINFAENTAVDYSEARLSSLKTDITDGVLIPEFDSNKFEYSITTEEEEITITPTALDELAKVNINKGTNGKVKLDYDTNEIEITVTAQDGTKKTYKLTVTRKDNRNDNSRLQLLSVDGKQITLKNDKFDYEIDVAYETEHANLLYAATSASSKIEISGSETLAVGKNEIIITVTSEKGNAEKYYLTINRLKKIESADSSIKKLEITNVDNLDFNFKSDTHNYTIQLPKKVNKLNFNIELNDEKAEYNITGNENLENYSKVLIKVTAEDQSTTTYTILIEKKESNNLMIVLIALIIILLAIIVAIIVLINKNKKNKKNNKKDSKEELVKEKDQKKTDDNVVVFTDPGDSVISSEEIVLPEEEKKEENIIVFTDPEEDKSILTDTKEFVIARPKETVNEPFENPEFEENKVELENPMFNEKDISDGENPNFE